MDKQTYLEKYIEINDKVMTGQLTPINGITDLNELNKEVAGADYIRKSLMNIPMGYGGDISEEEVLEVILPLIKEREPKLTKKQLKKLINTYWEEGELEEEYSDIEDLIQCTQMWVPSNICY